MNTKSEDHPKKKKNTKSEGPFLQICRGKRVLELSNSNTDQMDVDQATAINFQEEIIMEILGWLPVRYLIQFKCVSNFWNTVISDPYFKRMHLKRAKNDQNSEKFLICQWDKDDMSFSCYCCPLSLVKITTGAQKLVRPLSSKRFFRIQCCFDGLFFVTVSDALDDMRPILLLWNPSTKESVVLPSVELDKLGIFGLGYDSSSNDYKILKVSYVTKQDPRESSEILSLKSGLWRKIDNHPHGIHNRLDHMHALAFVHEAFHWIGMSRNYSLVSFSISNEAYGEIPLPERLRVVGNIGTKSFGVSVLDGMLCVYSHMYNTFKLWVMKDYGVKDTWSALFTMKDHSVFLVVPKYRFGDGEVLLCCFPGPSGGQVFRTPSGPFIHWPRGGMQTGFAFTESLISPKSLVY